MVDTFNITQYESANPNRYAGLARAAFDAAMGNEGKLTEDVFSVVGFSGRKIRLFFNNLISSIDGARYMEIGVYCGASFISAIFRNKVNAIGIDNWSWEGSQRALFYQKLAESCSDGNTISLLDMEFHNVNFSGLGGYNVLFYDGSHEEQDQYDGVTLPQPALADEYVLIVDDWNWDHVRRATFRALKDVGARIDMSIELRTTMDNTLVWWSGSKSDWHNGLFIAAVKKQQAANP